MGRKKGFKSRNQRRFLCGTISLAFLIFIWMASVNGAEIIASQYLSKSEISLSESSRVTIDLKGSGEPCIKPIDAVLAIDSTGSMTQSDPSDLRKSVAKDFVSKMDFSKDKAAIVSWDTEAIAWKLTNNSSEFANEIEQVDSAGNTDLNVGLASSIGLLANSRAVKIIIFLTDGDGSYVPSGAAGSLADLARTKGVMIFTIGLGQSANEVNLKEIAETTGGEYYPAPDANALAGIYQNIYSKITNIAAENTSISYVLPSSLVINKASMSQPTISSKRQGDSTILTWYVGSVFINQSRIISFDIGSQDPGTFTLGTAPNTIAGYANCNGIPKNVVIPPVILVVKMPEPFSLTGSGVGGNNLSVVKNTTVLKVTKEILPNQKAPCPDCPEVKITLETPPKLCNVDLLFVIDKSGSMRDTDMSSGSINYAIMRNAITRALGNPMLANANVAIVSWDDDSNQDSGDVDTTLNPQWINVAQPEIGLTLGNWTTGNCKETDQTIYSEGIEHAIKVMGPRISADIKNKNPLRCVTKRFIIFVASSSEFRDSPTYNSTKLDTLLFQISRSNWYQNGFQGIFTFYVGDPTKYPWVVKNLTDISQITMNPLHLMDYPVWLSPTNLTNMINSRLVDCDKGPWITNVKLTDTLYPYLKFDSANPRPSAMISNKDGSTTLEWDMGTLDPGNKWTATISTSLQLKLPVDVTKSRSGFGGNISSSTPYSRVEFDWPAFECAADYREHYELPLEEGKLWVTCGAPCQVTKTIIEPTQSANTTSTKKTEAPVKQPGFEAVAAIGGLMLLAYLRKEN
jgi:Ca-activated chloride channel family protein